MTREFLKSLGLADDITGKIIDEHGKGLTAEQKKLTEKEKELALVQKSLDEANTVIQSYKDMKLEDIKKSAADWEEKAKNLETEKTEMLNRFTLEKALMNAGAHDAELLEKAIDKTTLKFENGKVKGLDSQLKELKETKAFLFKQDTNTHESGDDRFASHEPSGGTGAGKNAIESIMNGVFGD